MTFSRLPVVALFALLAVGAAPAFAAEAEPTRLRARVSALCAPDLAGRAAGSAGGAAAADTLAAWFAACGLQPGFGSAWKQTFPLAGEGWTGNPLAGLVGANVAAALPGDGALAGRWLVVAAHLDHLGAVFPDTAAASPPVPGGYYPGANDNASGVAVVHELAARLAAADPGSVDRRSVLFLNPDAEEVGLQGTAWFVDHAPVALDSVDVMVNLDTVGLLGDGRLIVSGIGTASPLEAAVAEASRFANVPVNPSRGGWSGSDHMVFNTREVPVLFLFGGPYAEYNRPSDTAALLDYGSLSRVVNFTAALVGSLQEAPGRFTWQHVEGALREDVGPSDGTGDRRTWLGTMPDFTEGQAGYRLASVFAGSPAAAAGLQKGDLLVRFGDYPVSDLATFTTALRAYAPGDLVEVGIVRDGRQLRFTVALGDRAQRR